jgi:hypothetical protein
MSNIAIRLPNSFRPAACLKTRTIGGNLHLVGCRENDALPRAILAQPDYINAYSIMPLHSLGHNISLPSCIVAELSLRNMHYYFSNCEQCGSVISAMQQLFPFSHITKIDLGTMSALLDYVKNGGIITDRRIVINKADPECMALEGKRPSNHGYIADKIWGISDRSFGVFGSAISITYDPANQQFQLILEGHSRTYASNADSVFDDTFNREEGFRQRIPFKQLFSFFESRGIFAILSHQPLAEQDIFTINAGSG